ncbi:DNRLRE domain-containing protein, partial [Dehalobacter sp.]
MKRLSSKLISTLLILTLFFTGILPQAAFAASETEAQVQQNGAQPDFTSKKEVHQLLELTELRDQHTKHYLNDDGSRTAEVSLEPVHYKDANEKWQDISNKLVPSNEQGFSLQNEANSFKTRFANNSRAPYLVSIQNRQLYSVSWGIDNPNNVNLVKKENTVTYPEVYSGVDLEYTQLPDGVKEDIILKAPGTSNYFTFNLKTGGLTPKLQDDGSIGLFTASNGKTPGEIKFSIPKPYMIDSNSEKSLDVTFQLKSTGEDTCQLNVIADYNWLSDPARSYPVKIDPIVTVYDESASVNQDTYILENYGTQDYNSINMYSGYDSTNQGRTRSLVQFNLPSIPSGSIVTDAVFRTYKNTTTAYDDDFLVARIKSGWSVGSVTWANKYNDIDLTNEKTPTAITHVLGSHTGWVDFNVWSIVKGWYASEFSNAGFMLMNNQEGNPTSRFYTSNNGSNIPGLKITYITDPLGLNPYWGYANTPWGSVNTMSGNFLSSSMDYSLPGRGIPIAVSRTYNSRSNLTGIFGNKLFSNLDMQLQYETWGRVLVDSSGAERPFLWASDGQTFIAPTNYPMQLYKNGDGTFTLQEAYTNPGIIDKSQYTLKAELPSATFNSSGKLIQLKDGKGNTTSLTWNASSVVITDPSNRQVTINLDANGRATSIQEPGGAQKVTYSYDGSGNLTKVTYKDAVTGDKSVSYEWDNGVIIKAVDKNGTPIYLQYNSSNQTVSIGAVNMLGNPSFEDLNGGNDPYLWDEYVDQDNGSVTQDATNHFYDNDSVKIESVFKSGTSGTSYLYAYQQVKVKPNQQYTFSSFIKTSGLNGRAFLNVRQLDANQNHISWTDNRPGITGTNDWTDSRLTFTTSGTTQYVQVYMEIDHDATHFGGIAYFDGAQLEEGNAPSGSKFFGHTDFWNYTESTTQTTLVTSPSGEQVKYQNNKWGNPILIMNDVKDKQAKTIMSWDTSDRLRSLITPEHSKTGGDGNGYTYTYDIVGNMTNAKDPLDRQTSHDYYYNHLQKTTLPDSQQVATTWDPVNLTGVTSIDQSLNSKAYIYNTYGNLLEESNTIGVADNRILNNNFETGYDSIAAPTFARSSSAYTLDGLLVGTNEPRYATGKFGQALTIEKATTNLIDTQGGGASTDWTKWNHWGARSYWSSETQTDDPNYGKVYAGVNANSTETYLYDYYPYSITSGQSYTVSMYLKASQNWTGTTAAYFTNSDWSFYQGTNQNISLTTSWQKFTWTITASQTKSAIGLGIKFANLPSGVTLQAARPQLENLPYATSYANSSRSGETLTLPSGLFSASQGTIEAWVKPLRNYDSSTSNSIQMITDVAGTGNNGLLLAIDQYGKFYTQAGTGSSVVKAISTTTAQKDTWYHVAGRWNASGLSIFVNGVKETTTPSALNISLSQTPMVGRQSSTDIRYLDGLIDDLRISNIARTDTAIQDSYNLMKPTGTDSSTTYKLNFDQSLRAVYQPTGWSKSSPTGRVSQAEYDPTAPYGGSNVLHINPGTDASAYQWTDYIALTGVDDFIVSGDIKVNGSGTDGVRLHVYWFDTSYTEIAQDRCFVINQTQDWKRYSMSLTPP